MRAWPAILLLTGCGRIDFEQLDDGAQPDFDSALACAPVTDTRLTNGIGNSFQPAMIATATGYAIVWTNTPDSGSGLDWQIRMIGLDRSGAITIPEHDVSVGASQGLCASIAATTNGYAVAWSDSRTPSGEYIQLLDANGMRTGLDAMINDHFGCPNLAALQGELVDVFGSSQQLLITHLDAHAQPITADAVIAQAGTVGRPVWSNGGVLLVWTTPTNDVELGVVRPDGMLLAGPSRIATGTRAFIARTPSGFVLAYEQLNHIYTQEVDFSGAPVGAERGFDNLPNGESYATDLVATSTGFAVGWQGEMMTDNQRSSYISIDVIPDVLGTRMLSQPILGGDVVALAAVPGGVGYAWTDTRDGNEEIYFAANCD